MIVALLLVMPISLSSQFSGLVPPANVTVRYYKMSVRTEQFRAAQTLAARILVAAGVRVLWLQCWSDGWDGTPSPAECEHPLSATELILHIVRAVDATSSNDPQPLGSALIDRQAGAGTVAMVYANRVARLALDARADGDALLGRVIAHEIGHLLMGTNQHAAGGLMRGFWSLAELRQNRRRDWMFSEHEALTMRSAIDVRGMNRGPEK